MHNCNIENFILKIILCFFQISIIHIDYKLFYFVIAINMTKNSSHCHKQAIAILFKSQTLFTQENQGVRFILQVRSSYLSQRY